MITDERIGYLAAERAELRTVAGVALADLGQRVTGRPGQVGGTGGWGPWVNGGAWLTVDGTAVARTLADPEGRLGDLQARLRDVPPALATALVDVLREADSLVDAAGKGAERCDPTYLTACLWRAVLLAAHALYARAGTWVTNQKVLVALAGAQPGGPERFAARAGEALGPAGSTPGDLGAAEHVVRELVGQVHDGTSA